MIAQVVQMDAVVVLVVALAAVVMMDIIYLVPHAINVVHHVIPAPHLPNVILALVNIIYQGHLVINVVQIAMVVQVIQDVHLVILDII